MPQGMGYGNNVDFNAFRQRMIQKYPNMNKSQLQGLNNFIQQKQAQQLVTQGKLSIEDIPQEQRVGVMAGVGAGYKQKEKPLSAESQKLSGLGKSGLQGVQTARQLYREDPVVLAKQLVPGKFASRKFDSALFSAVDSLLRLRTGAAAPEKEIRRYMRSIGPWIGDNPETVEYKFKQLEEAISSGTGVEKPTGDVLGAASQRMPTPATASATQPAQQPNVTKGALGFLGRIFEPERQGLQYEVEQLKTDPLGFITKISSPQQIMSTAVKDPEFRKKFGGGSASLLGKVQLAKSIGSLPKTAKDISSFIKGGGVKGVTARKRDQLAKQVTTKVSTSKLSKPVEEFLKKHPEAATKANKRLLKGLKGSKNISVSDLLQRTQLWNEAYKSSGGVAKGLKNKIYNILARAGKAEIKSLAPEVAKETAKLRFLYQAPKATKKATWEIGKLLGIKKLLGL